jgi:hypothetical protein
MTPKKSVHNFLTLDDLRSFNEGISDMVSDTVATSSDSFDENTYTSKITTPDKLDESFAYQLADLIDKKVHMEDEGVTTLSMKSPNTIDLLLASDRVAYVKTKGSPVAVATIKDPTRENYMGIIPADFYALKSAISLDGRYQQEFFAVADEYHDLGLAAELRRLLERHYPKMFTVVPSVDKESIQGLTDNGYKFISEFETDWDLTPVQIWFN